jgi:hypothetical protein
VEEGLGEDDEGGEAGAAMFGTKDVCHGGIEEDVSTKGGQEGAGMGRGV